MREIAKMATPATALNTPLAATHLAAGAKMGVWFGCALPDYFGDAAAEYRSARDTVALIDKNYRAYLSFTGPDRVRYLNAILTNNIKDLQAGHGIVSLLLNPQGHILAEIETYAFPDRLLCVSYSMIRERLIEVLDKYIIMDDVTLIDETPRYGTLALEGPKAAALIKEVSRADVANFEELSAHGGKVGSIPCWITKRSPGGVPGAEFLAEREKLPELWQILSDAARWHEGGPMGYAALSARSRFAGQPHQLHQRLLHRPGNRRTRALPRPGKPSARPTGFFRRGRAGSGHAADCGGQGSGPRYACGADLGPNAHHWNGLRP